MKSDYAYTVTEIAVKCLEWQIPNNITDNKEELPLQSDVCVHAYVCVCVCVFGGDARFNDGFHPLEEAASPEIRNQLNKSHN